MPRPIIVDCAGPILSDEEKTFFQKMQPYGFILFKRHCQSPEQLRHLTKSLRDCLDHDAVPILIDQEGGRVARMTPPHWRQSPAGGVFADLAKVDLHKAERAVFLNAYLMACDLKDVGVNVDCYPLLDILHPQTHDVIGDRSFGEDVDIVSKLGRSACEGLLNGGVLPVIKHIPGHGRATLDSHHALPRVAASRTELEQDFAPFRALCDMPLAMTAHILYEALDPSACATLSKHIVHDIIRHDIGFKGVILSDDLMMKALGGTLNERATAALTAGCDVLLLCNASLAEQKTVLEGLGLMSDNTHRHVDMHFRYREEWASTEHKPFPDIKSAKAELQRLIS